MITPDVEGGCRGAQLYVAGRSGKLLSVMRDGVDISSIDELERVIGNERSCSDLTDTAHRPAPPRDTVRVIEEAAPLPRTA